ncbi:MAG: hypothetical protein J6C01_02505 [Lachnospiraceae bacterium]|nr:hypothetical protein [Lachnospiraceae bacterium]
MRPNNYGFAMVDIANEQLNIKQCYRYEKDALVVAEISCEVGDRLMNEYLGEAGSMGRLDTDSTEKTRERYRDILHALDCHLLLLVWKSQDEDRLLFISDTRRVRALEFIDYLIAEFGLVRGNAEYASGQISSAILAVQLSGMDLSNTMEYFLQMTMSYYEDCHWVEAAKYGVIHCDEIARMTKYYKKKIAWAYVKSTDVVPQGEQVRIKSLENESGMLLTADEDTYIMIGCRGEVYDIKREKFERTYEATDEALDVFEQMLDFLPAIEKVSDGDYISLDDVANLCYPRRGAGIYASELSSRTKVFPANDSMEYFLGRPGDYMAVRLDDFTDIYVIQREIFLQTYEQEQ